MNDPQINSMYSTPQELIMEITNLMTYGIVPRLFFTVACTILLLSSFSYADSDSLKTSFTFKGQLSGWGNYSSSDRLPLNVGGRYLPQIDINIAPHSQIIPSHFQGIKYDFEVAANLYGSGAIDPFDYSEWDGGAKLYRGWARVSTDRAELRVGLQKINFGSATLLRPLMWFDRIDPRDPLQLTDGVWGILGRYYFGNNTNIWLWGLYGNKELRPWEVGGTVGNIPEFGGRVQFALPKGEAAFSYHHRKAEVTTIMSLLPSAESVLFADEQVGESRFGLDAKFDLTIGLWIEASWIQKEKAMWNFTNQALINIGTDYTFGVGNGLNVVFEHLLLSYDRQAFQFGNTQNLSALSMSYPAGLFDNVSFMLFYDWKNGGVYNFINWKHTFKYTELYVMGYINPDNFQIPGGGIALSHFAGKGIQVMLVFNHQSKK